MRWTRSFVERTPGSTEQDGGLLEASLRDDEMLKHPLEATRTTATAFAHWHSGMGHVIAILNLANATGEDFALSNWRDCTSVFGRFTIWLQLPPREAATLGYPRFSATSISRLRATFSATTYWTNPKLVEPQVVVPSFHERPPNIHTMLTWRCST